MMRASRLRSAAALIPLAASLLVLDDCHDSSLNAPGGLTAAADLSPSLALVVGTSEAAFDKVDQVFVQMRVGGDVRAEQKVPFTPSTSAVTLRLEVPLRQTSENVTADVELRSTGKALFRGTATPTLTVGARTPVALTLNPVTASVACGPDVQIGAYGPFGPLSGTVLFATGDTIQAASLTWSATSGDAATVSAAGDVTAVKDGDVQVACAHGGVTGTRTLHVVAVVTRVDVAPALDTIRVGSSVTLTPTLREAGGNVVTTPRPIVWASSGVAATVNASGLVSAASAGTVQITATSGNASGTATIVVLNPPPIVTTSAASNIGVTSATLNGSVRPNGPTVTAWFEWGTDAQLASPQSTAPQAIANVSADVSIAQAINGLAPGVTYFYRAVATNSDGAQVRGATLSFTTLLRPSVTTSAASNVVGTGATLNGTVRPNGPGVTGAFEWGTDAQFATSQSTAPQPIANLSADVAIAQAISGLTPGVTYFYRAVATNSDGVQTRGATLSFTTLLPPSVTTNAARVAATDTLSATINPNGSATTAWFQFTATPTNAGAIVSPPVQVTPKQDVGAGTTAVSISALVISSPFTTYAVTAMASNAGGTTAGKTITFQTAGPPVLSLADGFIGGCNTPCVSMTDSVNAQGAATDAWFEVSNDSTFTSFTATTHQAVAAGTGLVQFTGTAPIDSTQTVVFIRGAASNVFGTVRTPGVQISAAVILQRRR